MTARSSRIPQLFAQGDIIALAVASFMRDRLQGSDRHLHPGDRDEFHRRHRGRAELSASTLKRRLAPAYRFIIMR